MKLKTTALAVAVMAANNAYAEDTLSFYSGYQTAPHSTVEYNDPSSSTYGSGDFTAAWEGKSEAMPPYYGFRWTHWYNSEWGVSVDYAHAKVYSDNQTRADNNLETLEFTDGLNPLTVNALRRYQSDSLFTPYWGLGAGITIPHVEFQTKDTGAAETYEFQFGGLSLQAQAGVDYKINDTWSVFGEYKFNYSMVDVDLKGGGDLQTDIVTNALNIGVNYKM